MLNKCQVVNILCDSSNKSDIFDVIQIVTVSRCKVRVSVSIIVRVRMDTPKEGHGQDAPTATN